MKLIAVINKTDVVEKILRHTSTGLYAVWIYGRKMSAGRRRKYDKLNTRGLRENLLIPALSGVEGMGGLRMKGQRNMHNDDSGRGGRFWNGEFGN